MYIALFVVGDVGVLLICCNFICVQFGVVVFFYGQTVILTYFIHPFHCHVQNATIPWHSQELLPFPSVIYFPGHPSPPTILPSSVTSSCYLYLCLVVSIYNTLLGILFPSILCTSPNQHYSISFHSLYIPKPTQFYFLPLSVHPHTNTILFPSTLCPSPNQHNLCKLTVSVTVGF
jgi:hypothetical protein